MNIFFDNSLVSCNFEMEQILMRNLRIECTIFWDFFCHFFKITFFVYRELATYMQLNKNSRIIKIMKFIKSYRIFCIFIMLDPFSILFYFFDNANNVFFSYFSNIDRGALDFQYSILSYVVVHSIRNDYEFISFVCYIDA